MGTQVKCYRLEMVQIKNDDWNALTRSLLASMALTYPPDVVLVRDYLEELHSKRNKKQIVKQITS